MYKEFIIQALSKASLEGFTTPIIWTPARYIVAVTNNNKGFSYSLLNKQAMELAKIRKNVNIWGWQDSKTWDVYIDVSTSFKTIKEAFDYGRNTKQIAIWDSLKNREIDIIY